LSVSHFFIGISAEHAKLRTQGLVPRQVNLGEHGQPAHLLGGGHVKHGLRSLSETLEGFSFEFFHQRQRKQQHLKPARQVQVHAQAQLVR
jgi:hypothetical protein